MGASMGEASDSNPVSRGRFLRKLGTTLAIGLGIALVPAGKAHAEGSSCCPDSTCPSCNNGTPTRCFDSCSRTSCCMCTGFTSCQPVPCPCG